MPSIRNAQMAFDDLSSTQEVPFTPSPIRKADLPVWKMPEPSNPGLRSLIDNAKDCKYSCVHLGTYLIVSIIYYSLSRQPKSFRKSLGFFATRSDFKFHYLHLSSFQPHLSQTINIVFLARDQQGAGPIDRPQLHDEHRKLCESKGKGTVKGTRRTSDEEGKGCSKGNESRKV